MNPFIEYLVFGAAATMFLFLAIAMVFMMFHLPWQVLVGIAVFITLTVTFALIAWKYDNS
jgi:membrane protein implicated in regulation of membrane protease activity